MNPTRRGGHPILDVRPPSIPVLLGGSLAGGLAFGVVQETQDQGFLFWAFVVTAMALAAAAAAFGPGDEAKFGRALKAVPLLVVALLALSLGDFMVYLAGAGGRSLEQYRDGVSMSGPAKLAATLVIGAVYGALLGLVSALVAWLLRRAAVQARGA